MGQGLRPERSNGVCWEVVSQPALLQVAPAMPLIRGWVRRRARLVVETEFAVIWARL